MAPVLNAFVQAAHKKQFKFILIAYYAFMVIWGWLFPKSTDYISGGYSPILFVWLYMLARYIRLYPGSLRKLKLRTYIIVIAAIALFIVICCISAGLTGGAVYGYILLQYISPTTIVTAALVIIITSRLHISNKLINRLATSSFAVYLVYVNPNILTPYCNFFNNLYHFTTELGYWLSVIGLVLVMYLAVAAIDTIRIFVWKRIENKL